MSNHGDNYCGGAPTKVEIVSPIHCTTLYSKKWYPGDNVFWEGDELGSCNETKIDTTNGNEIRFKIVTSSGEDFCPKYLDMIIGRYIEYNSAYMDHWHDWHDNEKEFITKKIHSGNFCLLF